MSKRRMFEKDVTDELLDLPVSAQALYFHIGMNTDDEGYCKYLVVIRLTLCNQKDLQHLIDAGFVYLFDEKILLDLHFNENNQLRKDRKKESKYLKLYPPSTIRQPNDNQMTAQVSIGEVSIGKKEKEKQEKEKTPFSPSGKKSQPDIVIDFLNEICGTKYKSNAAATKKHINARIKEGFTLDDFKSVIQKKYKEWHNTDMAQYLRPSTLFSPKFESYLNAPAGLPPNSNNNNNLNGKAAQKDQSRALKFNDLEYPIGIDGLIFNAPVEVHVYKKGLSEQQTIKFIGRLKAMMRHCDCGKAFITETDRKSCNACKNRESPAERTAILAHQKRLADMDKEAEKVEGKLTPAQIKENKKFLKELKKTIGL